MRFDVSHVSPALVAEFASAHGADVRTSEAQFFHGPAMGNVAPTWRSFAFASNADEAADATVDATAPPPFGRRDLAYASREPLFSRAECAAVVAEAEAERAWRGADPLASYAERGGSSFLPLRLLPRSLAWLNTEALPRVLLPAIADAFPHEALAPGRLRVSAASVVKYDASAGPSSLGVHRDGPLLAATISLNALTEYDGGGTFIEALALSPGAGHDGGVVRLDVGHLLLHPATVRHGGATTACGVRLILVVWLFSAEWTMPYHYALRRANGFLATALRAGPQSSFRREALTAALAAFDDALALSAGLRSEAAHLGLGQALVELGRAADALPCLEAALERAPSSRLAAQLLLQARATHEAQDS